MTKLTEKQQVCLYALEDGPLTTFDLFDCAWSIYEDMWADGEDPGFRDFSREGIYATMVRLEKRGLVERTDASDHDRKESVAHWPSIADDTGPPIVKSKSLPARYAWKLTAQGAVAISTQPNSTPSQSSTSSRGCR